MIPHEGHDRMNQIIDVSLYIFTFACPKKDATSFFMVFMSCPLQLMTLLASRQLEELLLRDAAQEAVQAGKDLVGVLKVEHVALGAADEGLDARQAVADEVVAEALVNLVQDEVAELGVVGGAALGEDLVDKARVQQVGGLDALAHDEGLVGLADAEALHEGARRAALGHKPQRREGRQQERVRRAVDEVGKGDQRGRQANDGPVEPDDQDLGVRVKGLRRVEVVGHKGAQPRVVWVLVGRHALAKRDVGAAAALLSSAWVGFFCFCFFCFFWRR
jgi:hypothetical protein